MARASLEHSIDVVARECFAVRLRALNRVVTNIYDEELRELDLKVSQMNILVAAEKMVVARPADVCRHLHLDVSTLSRNVERMRSRGWLETVAAEDGRAQPFRLTKTGRRLLERAIPGWKRAQDRVRKMLGEQAADSLLNAVGQVSLNLAT